MAASVPFHDSSLGFLCEPCDGMCTRGSQGDDNISLLEHELCKVQQNERFARCFRQFPQNICISPASGGVMGVSKGDSALVTPTPSYQTFWSG